MHVRISGGEDPPVVVMSASGQANTAFGRLGGPPRYSAARSHVDQQRYMDDFDRGFAALGGGGGLGGGAGSCGGVVGRPPMDEMSQLHELGSPSHLSPHE